MQFIPDAYFTSRQGILAAYPYKDNRTKLTDAKQKTKWDDLKELTDAKWHFLIDLLAENELPEPEIGYELAGKNGEIIAEAEFAWDDANIAFLLPDQMRFADSFKLAGWQVFNIETVMADWEKILNILN